MRQQRDLTDLAVLMLRTGDARVSPEAWASMVGLLALSAGWPIQIEQFQARRNGKLAGADALRRWHASKRHSA
jgi:hypothetical protein